MLQRLQMCFMPSHTSQTSLCAHIKMKKKEYKDSEKKHTGSNSMRRRRHLCYRSHDKFTARPLHKSSVNVTLTPDEQQRTTITTTTCFCANGVILKDSFIFNQPIYPSAPVCCAAACVWRSRWPANGIFFFFFLGEVVFVKSAAVSRKKGGCSSALGPVPR